MKLTRYLTDHDAPGWQRIFWRVHAHTGQPAYTPFTPAGDGRFVVNEAECQELVRRAAGRPVVIDFEDLLHSTPTDEYYALYQRAVDGVRALVGEQPIFLYGLFLTTPAMLERARPILEAAGTVPIDGYLEVGPNHPGRLPTTDEVCARIVRVARAAKRLVPRARRVVWVYNGYVFTKGVETTDGHLAQLARAVRKERAVQGVVYWEPRQPDPRFLTAF